jgi:serine/threonine-protein kinase
MARVFLAHDRKHQRRVAVKVLHSDIASAVGAHRFLREIEIAARLTHPHILPLHDSGSTEGLLYYVMPYIEGESLRERLAREGPLPQREALRIAGEVADALDYAHGHGVIHRDIKPGNILLSGGHAVVADFGIALAVSQANEALTVTGGALGTPTYMSPEQARGAEVDGRTDVYALGCVVYEMLSGRPPFPGPSVQAMVLQHQQQAPPSLRDSCPTIPLHVSLAVEVALAKTPDERFATAGRFSAALAGAEPTEPLTPPAPPPRLRIRMGSPVRSVLLVGAGLVLLGLGIWGARDQSTRFREKDWILVADFDAPPDDPGLGHAVRELATAELNQSRFLSTLPRQQLETVMQLAEVPDTVHVGPELARELAYRSAVRAILAGSVSRIGNANYSIVLHVLDADDGSDILSVAGAASDSNLVTSVQRLGRQVREGLGEHRSAIAANASLEQVATPSFSAYRRYSEALRLHGSADPAGSNRLLREAIALDSAFAAAWYVMAQNYLTDRQLDSARLAFAEALKYPGRLGTPLRYRVEADAAFALRYDLRAAVRAYNLYLDQDPRSGGALNGRGLRLVALGRYEEALRDFENAVRINPFGRRNAQIELANQVATLIALGRVDDARREMRDLTGPLGEYDRMMLAAATDQWAAADSIATPAIDAPSVPNWLRAQAVATAASARAAQGRIGAADRELARGATTASPDVARWYDRARLLLADVANRRPPPLPAEAAGDTTPRGLVTYGLWAAAVGDTGAARERLRRIGEFPPEVQTRLGYGPQLLEAAIAARGRRWADVVRLIGPAAARGDDATQLDRVNSLALRWAAADAYAQMGRLDSAIAMAQLVLRPTRMPGNAVALRGIPYPFAHRRLAIWYGQLGKHEDARRHWRSFLETLRAPDAELSPVIAQARATQAELARTD